MKSYFTSDFFKGNRTCLKKLLGAEVPIVITANSLLQRNSDIAFPFRQDSNFWYLTGLIEPELILVIDQNKEYLIVPGRSSYRNIFDGGIDVEQIIKRSGVDEVLESKEGWKRLGGSLKNIKKAATLTSPPVYVEHYEFFSNPARANLIKKLKANTRGLELLDMREQFSKMRVVKQKPELDAIKGAVNLTVRTLERLEIKLAKMKHEYEVEANVTQAFRASGAQHGYTPIIASGSNACILHYNENNSELNNQGLLLVDVGAEVEYYSADITRTYPISEPTKRQRAIHDAVVEVQDYVLDNLKPGVSLRESEKLTERFMGDKLRALGLIKVVEKDTVRHYFPHATSHYLGLDLHDIGDYEQPLEAGMVLTVEPGIYIPEEGIGVRIEDDVLVTEKGLQVLSAGLRRSLT